MRQSHRVRRIWDTLLLLGCLAAIALAYPLGAAAAPRTSPTVPAAIPSQARAEALRVLRYWTPARMRSARPLDLALHPNGQLDHATIDSDETATASFRPVQTPIEPPYSVNGRIFIRQGNHRGYCSGTAIDSPTRQLVLTAGHCVNSGPRPGGRPSVWSQYLEFVPAYTGGEAPFGAFVARRKHVYAPRPWTKYGNPDFDLGAFLTMPNSEGVNLADAVGGGVAIALDLERRQRFETFGYPGSSTRLQGCRSPYIGDDSLTFQFVGPPTIGIRCHWAEGASGGGWLIADGTQINGVTTYLHTDNPSHTYGPYFGTETVGELVEGL